MINITDAAVAEVKRIIGDEEFLRVGVEAAGCNGLSYRLRFDKQFDKENDVRYTSEGFDIVIDKKSDLYIDGTTLDWIDELMNRGFHFSNPAAVKNCGCGKSFSV